MRALLWMFLVLPSFLFSDHYLSLKGYISHEDLIGVQQTLTAINLEQQETLIINLSSSSGDLEDTFDIARQIYAMKQSKPLKVVVFINERAIGPTAIIPLLADELYVTPVAVWGDIIYNINPFVSHDVLKIEVLSLVPLQPMAQQIAQAMIDPSIQLAGIQQKTGGPLILGTAQMNKLGLIKGVLNEAQFHQKYPSLEDTQDVITPTDLRHELEEYIRVYPVGVNLVGYLEIGNEELISEKTYLYVKYALQEYVKKSVSCVLLRLNSRGGDLLSSMKISTLLQTLDLVNNIPVICFIDKEALSSSIFIAYSCRFIGASSLAVMGGPITEPPVPDGSLGPSNPSVISSLRSEISSVASFYGRNPIVAEAMVDPSIVLILRNGAPLELKPNDPIERNDEILCNDITLLTLRGPQLFELEIAQFVLQPELLKGITEDQLAAGRWPAASELAFQQPYLKAIPNAQILAYSSWKIDVYNLLINPLFFSLLIIGLFLGIYIEMHTAGFGLAGLIAMICLAGLISLNFILHTVAWIEVVMLVAGVLCLSLEIFLASGIGVVGILGIILTMLGLLTMMLPGIGKIDFVNLESMILFFDVIVYRVACFLFAIILSFIIMLLLSHLKKEKFKPLRQLLSKKESELDEDLNKILPKAGDTGIASSSISPTGKVNIGHKLFQASAEGGFIEKGSQIVVVRTEGHTVIVKLLGDS